MIVIWSLKNSTLLFNGPLAPPHRAVWRGTRTTTTPCADTGTLVSMVWYTTFMALKLVWTHKSPQKKAIILGISALRFATLWPFSAVLPRAGWSVWKPDYDWKCDKSYSRMLAIVTEHKSMFCEKFDTKLLTRLIRERPSLSPSYCSIWH